MGWNDHHRLSGTIGDNKGDLGEPISSQSWIVLPKLMDRWSEAISVFDIHHCVDITIFKP